MEAKWKALILSLILLFYSHKSENIRCAKLQTVIKKKKYLPTDIRYFLRATRITKCVEPCVKFLRISESPK